SASQDYSVVLWNLERRDAIFLVGGDPIVKGHVAFASEKSVLAIGEIEAYEDCHNSVFVIDLDSGKEVFRNGLRNSKEVAGLAISADGTTLVVALAHQQHSPKNSELTCSDLLKGKMLWKKAIKEMDITGLEYLPKEEKLVAEIFVEEHPDYQSGACLLDAQSGK